MDKVVPDKVFAVGGGGVADEGAQAGPGCEHVAAADFYVGGEVPA